MESIRRHYNPTVDLSKNTSNKKSSRDVILLSYTRYNIKSLLETAQCNPLHLKGEGKPRTLPIAPKERSNSQRLNRWPKSRVYSTDKIDVRKSDCSLVAKIIFRHLRFFYW